MKNIFTLFAIILLVEYSYSQEMVTQNRNIGSFSGVKVASGIDLYLKQGNTEKLELNAPSDKINKIITEVKNGVLNIYFERNNWSWGWNWSNKKSPRVNLSFKDLNLIVAGGGSDVFSEGRLLFDKVSLEASGGSDMKLELTAEMVEVETSGGSDTYLSGSTKYFKGNSSGGSDLKAKDLRTQFSKVTSSGGSDVYIWVESELSANSSGGSDIYYYGNPKSVQKHSSGGSDITRR